MRIWMNWHHVKILFDYAWFCDACLLQNISVVLSWWWTCTGMVIAISKSISEVLDYANSPFSKWRDPCISLGESRLFGWKYIGWHRQATLACLCSNIIWLFKSYTFLCPQQMSIFAYMFHLLQTPLPIKRATARTEIHAYWHLWVWWRHLRYLVFGLPHSKLSRNATAQQLSFCGLIELNRTAG